VESEIASVHEAMRGLLTGRVVVVSGIGVGLGRFIVEHSAACGASVMMSARSTGFGEQMLAKLGERYPVAFHAADVVSDDDCAALVAATVERFGGIDCVVPNAAAKIIGVTLEEGDFGPWREAMEVNFFGSLRLVKAALPWLKASGHGSVVFVGSQITRRVFPGRGAYASSKAALLTASQVLAKELGPFGIRVNTVVPGRMWGAPLQSGIGRLAASRGMTAEEQYQAMLEAVSLPDLATDEECARAVVFLASDLSASMTGQSIDTNAGETFH
jgi:NAD(P)-dependent dehydrogenase (short-subunit alcohol dehydrogenase family)